LVQIPLIVPVSAVPGAPPVPWGGLHVVLPVRAVLSRFLLTAVDFVLVSVLKFHFLHVHVT